LIESTVSARAWDELDAFCLKATTDEQIDEAMRLARLALQGSQPLKEGR
jgi:hypothetical protein